MFQAPVHFLVIPRKPIAMLDEVGGTFIISASAVPVQMAKCYGTYLLKLCRPANSCFSRCANTSVFAFRK
jgi:hypothetical protein